MKKISFLLFLFSSNFLLASSGGFEDSMADFMSWLVLIVLPIGGIYLFWKAHIYPEIVAEKNNHPQLEAIKSLCLLSLFFGGLLWPVAMVWASYKYPNQMEPAKATEPLPVNPLEGVENNEEVKINEKPE